MQQDLLTVEIIPGDGRVTLRLTGEIDLSTARLVREAALYAMHSHSPRLDIDMSGVAFMDSSGLEALLASRRRAELNGGHLRLIGLTHAVTRVIEVTGLNRLFEMDAVVMAMKNPINSARGEDGWTDIRPGSNRPLDRIARERARRDHDAIAARNLLGASDLLGNDPSSGKADIAPV